MGAGTTERRGCKVKLLTENIHLIGSPQQEIKKILIICFLAAGPPLVFTTIVLHVFHVSPHARHVRRNRKTQSKFDSTDG